MFAAEGPNRVEDFLNRPFSLGTARFQATISKKLTGRVLGFRYTVGHENEVITRFQFGASALAIDVRKHPDGEVCIAQAYYLPIRFASNGGT
jgi:hypothetical protein